MIQFKKADSLRNYLADEQKRGFETGFVPTMGALHAGHISLLEASEKENDHTIVSIFVNPAQFNDPQDFEKYPITIEKDIYLLEKAGCDVLFLPSVKEIYPDGIKLKTPYDLGYLETILDGQYRPGHFQGVCMVVQRLLEIVRPTHLYLGQKDYQQTLVIKKLIALMGINESTEVITVPTLREADGLAMSSRNTRLNEEDRKKAITIYQCLKKIKDELQPGNLDTLKNNSRQVLEKNGFKADYVEIVNAKTFALINEWDGKEKLIALIAAFMNEVRLIDNMFIN